MAWCGGSVSPKYVDSRDETIVRVQLGRDMLLAAL